MLEDCMNSQRLLKVIRTNGNPARTIMLFELLNQIRHNYFNDLHFNSAKRCPNIIISLIFIKSG